jgi:hypothetical protein
MVMIGDAVQAKKSEGAVGEHVEVLDVAQILARSLVRDEPAYRALTAPEEPSPAVESQETPALAGAAAGPAGEGTSATSVPDPSGGTPSAPEVG